MYRYEVESRKKVIYNEKGSSRTNGGSPEQNNNNKADPLEINKRSSITK